MAIDDAEDAFCVFLKPLSLFCSGVFMNDRGETASPITMDEMPPMVAANACDVSKDDGFIGNDMLMFAMAGLSLCVELKLIGVDRIVVAATWRGVEGLNI